MVQYIPCIKVSLYADFAFPLEGVKGFGRLLDQVDRLTRCNRIDAIKFTHPQSWCECVRCPISGMGTIAPMVRAFASAWFERAGLVLALYGASGWTTGFNGIGLALRPVDGIPSAGFVLSGHRSQPVCCADEFRLGLA